MFYRIKEEKIYDWADYKYADDCIETEIKKQELDENIDKFAIVNGVLTDISNTERYISTQVEKENLIKKTHLQSQIDELDKKRIRAIAEPALKDAQNGQTWLEYYTMQIQTLRAQM